MAALPVLVLALVWTMAARTVFSPLQQFAGGELLLGDLQLSLVQGLAVSLPVAALSIPVGHLVDRTHRLRLLAGLLAVSALGMAATALADSFTALFVARMLAGTGATCALPVAISIAADLSAPERRGKTLLGLSVGNMAGAAVAFALAGALLTWHTAGAGLAHWLPLSPWRLIHADFAVAGLALVLGVLCLREPARRETQAKVAPPLRRSLAALWARRAYLLPLFVGQVTVVMADTAAGIWIAPVITRRYGQAPEQFAGWSGLVILTGGFVGSVLGALTADFGQSRRWRGGILGGAVVAAGLSIPLAAYPLMPSATSFAWVLGLFLACGSITGLVTATAIAVRVPNELRGVCLGGFVVLGALIGFGVAPTLVSLVGSALGGPAQLPLALALVGVITSFVAFAGFLLAARHDGAMSAPSSRTSNLSDRS